MRVAMGPHRRELATAGPWPSRQLQKLAPPLRDFSCFPRTEPRQRPPSPPLPRAQLEILAETKTRKALCTSVAPGAWLPFPVSSRRGTLSFG